MMNPEGLEIESRTENVHGSSIESQKPEVFSFSDFRKYLEAYYHFRKNSEARFSYAKFSEEAGLGSPNYLKLVMTGHRNLTPRNIVRFSHALRLSQEESRYFERLVNYSQSQSSQEKLFHLRELESQLIQNGRENLEVFGDDIYRHPLIFVLREMARLPDFRFDAGALLRHLNISVSKDEITRTLEVLVAKKLIVRSEDGTWSPSREFLEYQRKNEKAAVFGFHLSVLENALLAVKNLPFEERDMSSHCLAMNRDDFPAFLKDLFQAISRVIQEYDAKSKEPNVVVQVNHQAICMTQMKSVIHEEDRS